jgi:F420H(2)-dependent quinone reductase
MCNLRPNRSTLFRRSATASTASPQPMNGWDEGHPSWWLNLKAHQDAIVRMTGEQARKVRALQVAGDERDRLWQRWVAVQPQLDGYAGRRSTETPVIVLEPREGAA